MKCFDCGKEYKSPTDNDDFRDLFSDFGAGGVAQAEALSGAYCADKDGWHQVAGGLWACPGCIANHGQEEG